MKAAWVCGQHIPSAVPQQGGRGVIVAGARSARSLWSTHGGIMRIDNIATLSTIMQGQYERSRELLLGHRNLRVMPRATPPPRRTARRHQSYIHI